MSYTIKVVWADGEEEYVKSGAACSMIHSGSGSTSPDESVQVFHSKRAADEMREFMIQGMDPDDFQSIDVVRHYRPYAE